jgi:transcriptional regulator with XRE-family HTH domain
MGIQKAKIMGVQIQAARSLLGLSAQDLAALSKLSRGTIQRAELESAPVTAANFERIVETLERLGITFLASNAEGPGVRLRKSRPRSKSRGR